MIRFIWLGAAIMALGGITTLFDRRYRFAAMVEGSQVKP